MTAHPTRLLGDVHVGDDLDPVAYPLTVYRLVMEAGANRDFNSIHHNSQYAQSRGAPEMYANFAFLMGMWERAVRDWMGPAGTFVAIRGFRMHRFNTVGRTTTVHGHVIGVDRATGLVTVEMCSRDPDGVTVGPGQVDVRLPGSEHARVPRRPADVATHVTKVTTHVTKPSLEATMLDPQARVLLDQMSAPGQPGLHELSPRQAREAVDQLNVSLGGPPAVLPEIRDLLIPGPVGTIPARLYRPAGTTPMPALVYFHGGGFVTGSLSGWEAMLSTLARESGCAIVSVAYRLAPEHKFPAGHEDAYAATAWVSRESQALGLDPARLAVGGDSAGGNLAAVVAILARDRGEPAIAFQLLIYPLADQDYRSESSRRYGEGHFITVAGIRWFFEQYTTPETYDDWRVHPLRAPSLADLPPAHVVVAECDPLHDEGVRYAERLGAEAAAVTLAEYPGMIHPFLSFPAVLDQARTALADIAVVLGDALAAGHDPAGAAAPAHR